MISMTVGLICIISIVLMVVLLRKIANHKMEVSFLLATLVIILQMTNLSLIQRLSLLAEGKEEYKLVDKPDGSRVWEFVKVAK